MTTQDSPRHAAAPVLTEADLADRWQIPPRTLRQWRYEGRGPKYLKLGGHVRYSLPEVQAYEAASEAA